MSNNGRELKGPEPGNVPILGQNNVFPLSVVVEGVVVRLQSDGSMMGDYVALETALAEMKGDGGPIGAIAWLLLRELKGAALGQAAKAKAEAAANVANPENPA